jgi:hypothetical protein
MFSITEDNSNKYLRDGKTRDYYLELAGDWVDEAPAPDIREYTVRETEQNFTLWDDSSTGVGTKGRWGDLLFSKIQSDEVVYVQPRVGWAGISLSALAKKYDKKLTLFMPASKQASPHQLVCIERGAKPVFRKIAAMPVLNKYAKDYADEVGATFVPFGLDHELVVAAGVKSTLQQWGNRPEPEDFVSVISTGVLSRTLQIAFPNSRFFGVAVARNLHPGEIGRANVKSYDRPFLQDSRIVGWHDNFNSAPNYDLKGFEFLAYHHFGIQKFGNLLKPSTLFWNVAGDIAPEKLTPQEIDSQRVWGEVRDDVYVVQ